MDTDVVSRLTEILPGRVATAPDTLAATSHDTWPVTTKWHRLGLHPNRAEAVVRAESEADISTVLRFATAEGVPVTVRAAASSVTGQPLPTAGGIVLDVMGLPTTLELSELDRTVRVSANHMGGDLEEHLQAHGLTLGHSPQSLYRSTVGGWLATMATGQFSSWYGGIEDLVVGYRVVLATGEVIDVGAKPRAAMGTELRRVFLGSEGTLGVITEVTLKVFPVPEVRLFETLQFEQLGDALRVMRQQVQDGPRPFLSRLYDEDESSHAMADQSFHAPVMFLGTQGSHGVAAAEMDVLLEIADHAGAKRLGSEPVTAWMGRRFDFSSVENRLALDGGYAETIEVAHLWSGIEALYTDMKAALAPLADEVLGHFSHVYPQGTSLYLILFGQAADDRIALDRLLEIWRTAMAVGLQHGAELSHHHGGGLARSPYSRRSLGDAHLILRRLKRALDPESVLNPGKLGL